MSKQQDAVDRQEVIGRPKRHKFNNKYLTLLVVISFLAGVLWLAAVRFLIVRSEETHYHANFAVYINNIRLGFNETSFYEEIAACSVENDNNPKGRVHMHEQVSDVIHIHDKRVTYGNFFHNIGWNAGDEVLETNDEIYQTLDSIKLTYILNGQKTERIDNRIIGNADQLLVSYGQANDAELKAQFNSISNSAVEVNNKPDPASCSGLNEAGHDSFLERLKRATFWE
ncbi:MAG: hypothetical protein M3Q14_04145 [bacterium]|nr:hypothetical protein [bacterium]